MKKSALQCLEGQLWRAAIPCSYIQKTVPHLVSTSVTIPQRRCYNKFVRTPLEVRPTKKDQGKMLLNDYMEKTSPTVNKEVLDEAQMIRNLTQTQGETHYRTKKPSEAESYHVADQDVSENDFSEPNKEQSRYSKTNFLKNRHIEDTKHDPNVQRPVGERKPQYVHPDPLISKALRDIHSELFSNAFGKYRSLLSQCATTKLRNENDLVLLEGPKLIREALLSGLEPIALYQSRQKTLLEMMPQNMTLQEKVERIQTYKTFKTSYKKLSTWSSVVKGQGLLGVFRLSEAASAPRLRLNKENSSEVAAVTPVTIVLDGVKEPGNLGAIIRTVAAIGAHDVVLMKGCCDPWEGKALRAGCGAHFSLRITRNVSWDTVYSYVPHYPNVFVADVCNSDREAMRTPDGDDGFEEEEYEDEHEGPAVEEERCHDQQDGQATRTRDDGIRRHNPERKSKFLSKDDLAMGENGEEGSDDKTGVIVGMDEEGKEVLIDNSFNDEEHVSEFSNVRLPTKYYNKHVYYPPNLKKNETPSVVLVIGSEAGLSSFAKKFVVDNFGYQVSVPLHSGMDSLNTSVASGIILYEMWNQAQKQLPAAKETTAVQQ